MLVNSTRLGPVLTEKQLSRDRRAGGFRIGDGKRIDFFRYLAWLYDQRHAPPEAQPTDYEQHRDRMGRVQRAKADSVRDIGTIPAMRHPHVHARGKTDLAFFLKITMPGKFPLPWSPDQLKVITEIQTCVLEGGTAAIGMPRGGGKTSITEGAVIWMLLYGHRRFASIIGPDQKHADDRLTAIKKQIENSPRLMKLFPECCWPIRKLDGIPQRRLLFQGKRIEMKWEGDFLALPNIPGSPSSEAVVGTCGITGQIRGQKFSRADLQDARPDFVMLDDCQTRESAKNQLTVDYYEKLILGDVLGLPAPGVALAAVMLCTVIYPKDLSDRFLDRVRRPEWQGIRTKMLYQFPQNMELWKQYNLLRIEGLQAGDRGARATQFYLDNREAMDLGSLVAWEARFEQGEVSAVQHAMNRWFRNEAAFAAECQNEPLIENVDTELLDAAAICQKVSGIERGIVPADCQYVTAFIDVQKACLFWMVCAWDGKFGGSIVDYGTFPDQLRSYFSVRDAQHTLERAFQQARQHGGEEAWITWGLGSLVGSLFAREWPRDDGAVLKLDRLLIDTGYQTDVVKNFCRGNPYSALLVPSNGVGISAKQKPMDQYRNNPGDRAGLNWRMPASTQRGEVRRVDYDTNFWKSFVQSRLATAPGDPGSLTLFGDDPAAHELLADHLTAEYRIKVTVAARSREVWEWMPKVGKPDNHWLDGLVGCAVGADICGAKLIGVAPKKFIPTGPRTRVTLPAAPGKNSFFVTNR